MTSRLRKGSQDSPPAHRSLSAAKELWDTCVLTKQTNDVYMVPEARTDPDTVLTRVVMQDAWLHPYSTRTTNKTYTMWEEGGGAPPLKYLCASNFCVVTFFNVHFKM